jgi:hypothetical protein
MDGEVRRPRWADPSALKKSLIRKIPLVGGFPRISRVEARVGACREESHCLVVVRFDAFIRLPTNTFPPVPHPHPCLLYRDDPTAPFNRFVEWPRRSRVRTIPLEWRAMDVSHSQDMPRVAVWLTLFYNLSFSPPR